ncbi:MAG: hypothetical protein IPH31_18110 [Lewinellaceae bacterium]|nr:hypothetical protein [Lewinellaceae bacterium]
MKNLLFTLLLALPFPTFSQNEKAVKPVASPLPALPAEALRASAGKTRAVVIGISDYQDPKFPTCASPTRTPMPSPISLRSPAGGSLDGDHLKGADRFPSHRRPVRRRPRLAHGRSKPGDQAIIYFSGHGDVETKPATSTVFCFAGIPCLSRISGAYSIFSLERCGHNL